MIGKLNEFSFAQSLSHAEAGLFNTIDKLGLAVEAHREWLAAWHRQVILRLPADPDDIQGDVPSRCRLVRWFENGVVHGLVDRAQRSRIGELHAWTHLSAAKIAVAAASDHSVAPEAYDALSRLAQDFEHEVLELERKLRNWQLEHDPFAVALSRYDMLERLDLERERAARTRTPTSLAMLDLDHVKSVDGRYGRVAGDALLRSISRKIRQGLRWYDIVYRYGGDESLACLPGTDLRKAIAVLERLRVRLAGCPPVGALGPYTTASIGVTELCGDIDLDQVMKRADQALYAAKKAGRNRICAWGPNDMTET